MVSPKTNNNNNLKRLANLAYKKVGTYCTQCRYADLSKPHIMGARMLWDLVFTNIESHVFYAPPSPAATQQYASRTYIHFSSF